MTAQHRIDGTPEGAELIDLIGGQLEIVARSDAPNADVVVLRGAIAPGAGVPLHSHADYECFYVLSGQLDVFVEPHGWTTVEAGRSAVVARGERHAVRNPTDDAVALLVTINNRLLRFFQEAGSIGVRGQPPAPPTPERIAHFLSVAERYGYQMASPAEHAAVTGSGDRSDPA